MKWNFINKVLNTDGAYIQGLNKVIDEINKLVPKEKLISFDDVLVAKEISNLDFIDNYNVPNMQPNFMKLENWENDEHNLENQAFKFFIDSLKMKYPKQLGSVSVSALNNSPIGRGFYIDGNTAEMFSFKYNFEVVSQEKIKALLPENYKGNVHGNLPVEYYLKVDYVDPIDGQPKFVEKILILK